jgi:hypothetical protein
MISYTFWHRLEESIHKSEHEARLINFHEILKQSKLDGYVGSIITRINGAPWFQEKSSEGYEEWYIVTGSDKLDALNEIAVSGARKDPHDKAAQNALDMHAGLYQLRTGSLSDASGSNVIWFSKPQGTKYESLYNELPSYLKDVKASLWRRQMVLGPTSEFCITSEKKVDLPEKFKPLYVKRQVLWKSDAFN